MAHYGGAEKVSPDEQTKIDAFYQFVSPWGDALNALWTDGGFSFLDTNDSLMEGYEIKCLIKVPLHSEFDCLR
jgi:hypothetical protein